MTDQEQIDYCEYSLCPSCGEVQEDLDGFGVLFCEKCRYCKHASVTGDLCDFCQEVIDD